MGRDSTATAPALKRRAIVKRPCWSRISEGLFHLVGENVYGCLS
jgi:hypothetical protein